MRTTPDGSHLVHLGVTTFLRSQLLETWGPSDPVLLPHGFLVLPGCGVLDLDRLDSELDFESAFALRASIEELFPLGLVTGELLPFNSAAPADR